MDYILINSNAELAAVCKKAQSHDAVAIDTEFVRTRTLMPQLGLIQLFDGEQLVLIDPIGIDDVSPLVALLVDQTTTKVLHSCSEDLETFLNAFGVIPSPIFDTQFAAHVLGIDATMGYARIVDHVLGIELDKGESRTDWLARPLSEKQCAYAANDVLYLLPVYRHICEQLDDKKYHWVVEEIASLSEKKKAKMPLHFAYLQFKNTWRLNATQLTVLQALAAWRLNRARHKDMALNHVFKEANLLECAVRLPQSKTAMAKIGSVSPQELRFHGQKVLTLIAEAMEQLTQTPGSVVPKVKRLIDMPRYKQKLAELKQLCVQAAKDNEVGVDVIASKKQLNQVLKWWWFEYEETRALGLKPDLLTGWRKPLLEDGIVKILGDLPNWDMQPSEK